MKTMKITSLDEWARSRPLHFSFSSLALQGGEEARNSFILVILT
ncbi:hypothetical protein [Thermococcus guaymasensis]|nr:hypothetical protein [Thermococcus guaymasensis]